MNNTQNVVVDIKDIRTLIDTARKLIERHNDTDAEVFDNMVDMFSRKYPDYDVSNYWTFRITGLRGSMSKQTIKAIKLVRKITNLGLKDAKELIEEASGEKGGRVLNGVFVKHFQTTEGLQQVMEEFYDFGFNTEITNGIETIDTYSLDWRDKFK